MFSSVNFAQRGSRQCQIKGHTKHKRTHKHTEIYQITEHGNGGVTLLKSVQEAQQVYNRDSFTQLIPNFYSQK